ncbi:MAG: molybdate ABC transporter permease subunit [Acidobacteriota bacterium]
MLFPETLAGLSEIDWFPVRLTFQVATLATLIALVSGVSIGYLLARRRLPARELLDALVTLPLVLPPTVLGYYLLVLLGARSPVGRAWQAIFGTPLTFTWPAAVIAATIHALPLMIKSARAAIEDVPTTVENAARTLGAGEWRVFFTITLPLAWRGLLAATVLAFARALGDFGVTIMIAGNIPGRTQTAAIAIYDAVQAGRDNQALLLVVIISLISVIILYLMNYIGRGRL